MEFGGQGCIKSFYRAGRWPKSGSDKVIQMLKDKLKEDPKDADVAKRKDAGASKKRKRENGAYRAIQALGGRVGTRAFHSIDGRDILNG